MRERPRQVNCQQEPPYPDHFTAVIALSDPSLTIHHATQRCMLECPHPIAECAEFNA